MIELDVTDFNTTMFGAAILAGRLVVTVQFKSTDEHVGLEFKGWRPGCNGAIVPFSEATRMYVNVARSWDKVATLYPLTDGVRLTAKVWRDQHCDEQRWHACMKVIDVARGEAPQDNLSWRLLLGHNCLRCGAELTEPESIEAGMGPHCRKVVSAMYGTRHQVKEKDASQSSAPTVGTPSPTPPEAGSTATTAENLVTLAPGESLDDLFERMMKS